jgi:PhnB protein
MQVQPYLFFEGRCDEALAFYRDALGAEVDMLMRYKDSPDPHMNPCTDRPDMAEKVMHAAFRIGETTLMGSDGMNSGKPSFQGFSLSLSPSDASEASRLFNALADGGQVHMPLTQTFFSPSFGMVADRFGVSWMIVVPGEIPKTQ